MIHRRNLFAWISGAAASLAAMRWFRGVARAEGETTMTEQDKIALFEKHVGAEIDGDMETTMATMTDNPHLTNVPTRIGGYGYDGVRFFYQNHLVGKFFPPDMKMTPVSRTVGEDQIVDELVISFTHTAKIDWMLPDVEPTGKPVEVAFAVIVGIKNGRISHEHIYWDQATVLAQIGLLDPAGLPVVGADGARRVLDPSLHATATP
jgi:carboxymethylenebutenolidase